MRLISLDRKRVLEELQRAAECSVHREDVLAVVLFGSLAEGTATGTSDADLLIVLNDSNKRFIDRIPEFLEHFRNLSLPVDVFPYTTHELNKQLKEGFGVGRTALVQGRLLAGKVPDRLVMSEKDGSK